ncbi:MAG: chemotaxis protein CheX [Gemmatimonadales bacterium]
MRISGEWAGAVVMCVPFALARDCGAHMDRRPAAALTPAEVANFWGELVNMVGGNLKALLPPAGPALLAGRERDVQLVGPERSG